MNTKMLHIQFIFQKAATENLWKAYINGIVVGWFNDQWFRRRL